MIADVNPDPIVDDEKPTESDDPMTKLEEALTLSKFGWFNVRLMCATFAACLASNMVVTTTSFVVPNARCDLDLTIMQQGVLTAAAFFGQILFASFTGFITDALGRKKFLISGYLGLFLCGLLEASSQNFEMMLAAKLFEGLFVSFGLNTTPAFLSECTNKKLRDRVMLMYSSFMSTSVICSSLMAWALLPTPRTFVVWEGYFVIHSWNLCLYVSAIWSGLAALQFYCLPESPKFLLSHGQSEKALEILKNIYTENTRRPRDEFPIKSLADPSKPEEVQKKTLKGQLTEGLANVPELFKRPLVFQLLLISLMIFVCLLSISSLRLWFPQISSIVEDYKFKNGDSARFCVMIDDYTGRLDVLNVNGTDQVTECVQLISGAETYTNGILMGMVGLFFLGISATLVECVGQKLLIFSLMLLCSVCASSLYWTNSSIQIAIMISAIIGFMQTTFSLFNTIFVRIFPTTVRTLALSIILMFGRMGSVSGSILFPVLLKRGCMMPFGILAGTTFVVALLTFLLPDVRKNKTGDR